MSEDAGRGPVSDGIVNAQGRVTIPAQLRREAGLAVGSRVVVYVEDGRVVVEGREQLMDRTRRDVQAALAGAPEPSIVDELLADRRAEVEAEA